MLIKDEIGDCSCDSLLRFQDFIKWIDKSCTCENSSANIFARPIVGTQMQIPSLTWCPWYLLSDFISDQEFMNKKIQDGVSFKQPTPVFVPVP